MFVAQVLVAELTERLVGAGGSIGQTILKMKWTNNKRKKCWFEQNLCATH
jgi:hypothetical protein